MCVLSTSCSSQGDERVWNEQEYPTSAETVETAVTIQKFPKTFAFGDDVASKQGVAHGVKWSIPFECQGTFPKL